MTTRSPERREPDRHRRSLTHVGGETRRRGDSTACERIAHALDVASSIASSDDAERDARAHVHGFHTYPARMHPTTARRLVEGFSAAGDSVLDPFCGSGTVLVEARLLGRRAFGSDINPLAVRLAKRKTTPLRPNEGEALLAAAGRIAELANTRRAARAGASHRYGSADTTAFDPHVLLELDSLRMGLDAEPDEDLRATLELVLSSILVKLSRARGDTASGERPTRIAAGYPARLFEKKTRELVERLGAFTDGVATLAAQPREARVFVGDARLLEPIGDSSIDLVVTSPPYPGVYDYVEHHRLRLRWLGLGASAFTRRELGSRRDAAGIGEEEARATFEAQLDAAVLAMARVLRPGGRALVILGDGSFGREAVRADELLADAAERANLEPAAIVSQPRPHFHGPTQQAFRDRPREEHCGMLTKSSATHATRAHHAPRRGPHR
ncbi:MAG: DNA methyltransferase [Polyangiaceae bacterium]